jgi:hypothetical protein
MITFFDEPLSGGIYKAKETKDGDKEAKGNKDSVLDGHIEESKDSEDRDQVGSEDIV